MIEKVTCQFCSSRCGMLINIENNQISKLLKAPCEHACPAGIDIPRYIRFIADGKYDDALQVIREKVPFPGVLGCVCHHPCEEVCRRGEADEALSIKALKDFVAAQTAQSLPMDMTPAASTGKKIAIIGSGPAGLTAAYNLTLSGHGITVFEALPEPGGMMRYGIPAYRLPREILDREIDLIKNTGVDIQTQTPVASVDDLLSQGFDAIFVGTGASRAISLEIAGIDDPKVMDCVSFLRRANSGEKIPLGETVAVLGGGYAAVDSARTAVRLGAKNVTIIYRRTRHEMKAGEGEIDDAIAEGVNIQLLAAPHQVSIVDGKLDLECIEQRLGPFDESGRRRPETVECTEFSQTFDTIISAIGQQPDLSQSFGLSLHPDKTIGVDPSTLATGRDGIYAGGDAVTGPASVIEAIAAGRLAAMSIDRYLGVASAAGAVEGAVEVPAFAAGIHAIPGYKNRSLPDERLAESRIQDFSRTELAMNESMAVDEADRCYWCDLVDGDPEHPLSEGWCCKRGRADTARSQAKSLT